MKEDSLAKEIAQGRIDALLNMARERTKSGTDGSGALAKRYVRLAKRISSRYKVKIQRKPGSYICKKCNSILIPGINAHVRLASSKHYIIYKCDCGQETHIFYK